MKILLLSALLLTSCASRPKCVILHFKDAPSPATINALAATQGENPANVAAWFNKGERGFVLSAVHTNEICLAISQGATIKAIK
jgi:hypothetical protein